MLLLFVVAVANCQKRLTSGAITAEHKTDSAEFPPELVDFVHYKGNPVFAGTDTDTWDRKIRERGYILREKDGYHLWYTGYNRDRSRTEYLGYATSPDGFEWTRYPGNPIFDKSWVEDMCIVKHGDTYYMFAEGLHDIAHMLTSKDKVHWQDHGSLEIRYTTGQPLSPGPYGTPTIWIEGKTWYLFYERDDRGIWLAKSTDRKVWTNVQDEPVIAKGPQLYDQHAVALNQVIKYKDRYYGYYHATAYKPWRDWTTNVAVSKDLVHWKKYPQNPIVTGDKSSGILVHDGTRYRLYTMHPDVRVYFPRGLKAERISVVAPGAKVKKLAGGFSFTEGPAADAKGNIFFSDIPNNRIHKWSLDAKLSTFRENSGGANGLYFDKDGNLLACEGGGRRLVSIDPQAKVTVLAEKYENKRFNSLNDLWIDPKGGIYFTDPRYGRRDDLEQDGEHVYYLSPDRKKLIRVIDDMVRPNGIIGTPDGKLLYVTDHGGKKTFVYTINKDATLSNKRLFAPEGSDGMTIDNEGNVYLTTDVVAVYNKNGQKIETIEVPERPANVSFGGKDKRTLFITARTSLYSVKMRVKGAEQEQTVSELGFEQDIIQTSAGALKITFIGHGTLLFSFDGKIIHVDPVSRVADYIDMPKADLILLTHEHGDHLDPKVIRILRKEGTQLVLTKACASRVAGGIVMQNGDVKTIQGLKIEAVPAYNILHMRSGRTPFHPKGQGNGYVITFGDKRVYVAGDTENTPEMKRLKNIDIAFLPMNLPYTMTPEMVADAAKAFEPKILYPYHYGQTDPQRLVNLLKGSKPIEVRIRKMR
jgi:sugar lactone lactonase YvrE/L-ascorbate metabolism protein UlaG (beta-lactamase superfamily)